MRRRCKKAMRRRGLHLFQQLVDARFDNARSPFASYAAQVQRGMASHVDTSSSVVCGNHCSREPSPPLAPKVDLKDGAGSGSHNRFSTDVVKWKNLERDGVRVSLVLENQRHMKICKDPSKSGKSLRCLKYLKIWSYWMAWLPSHESTTMTLAKGVPADPLIGGASGISNPLQRV